ncbi:YceI family protein [Paraburkholderia sp. SIMBA_055]|jgi:polyisoprenoid-binding protein YceI|uniref:YceI family protein n=1 Tax=Paraburkholderia graminis (strain ATCC 700544 / DSM 17151 / LMG 18924 / NCIMB 13744 / C4D1M) TaxID=396598 RepID=B1FUN5_PARG4|nr:YceI family protein [Paraburkholderia graminis]EDT12345.1 YceI family protein [Paraburkholderia graminis C4D1M]CAB3733696.1 Protein YceI [Paraburkholderia graminis C4D1M]
MNAFTARSIAVRALLAAMLLTSMACTPLQVLTHSVSQNEARVPVGRYDLDLDHCSITFDVEHFKYSRFTMRFDRKKGQLNWNEGGLEQSSVSVSIDAASIDTNVPLLDKMVKSESLLDVERYPEIRFVSTKFERTGESRGTLTGNLTIHGVTQPVTLDVTFNGFARDPLTKKDTLGFSAEGQFSRAKFGLATWYPAVGDDIHVRIQAEFGKTPAGA